MFKFWWPIGLIILSSVGYQVGLKEVSTGMDPFVALVVTYLVASAVSFAIYFIQGTGEAGWKKDIFTINPAALGLGAAIVGIELGNVYMYQAGWTVNTAFIVERPYRPRPHGHGDPPLRRKDHPEEDPGRRHFHGRHRRHHIGLTSISVCCIMK